ncbi:hypothetical protein M378DRAFT_157233 [Amanita muscaria Koide BX008]|uniref:Uncharacterized protein n=1 Tax=Amanita muscaria (strain Koide BX008) TaxID=946122 RepID=A0A0C2XLL5_AMAMK|nr:hypothetical protein M378DRAFT_157233 [Amanita muscaria Koide BX008]
MKGRIGYVRFSSSLSSKHKIQGNFQGCQPDTSRRNKDCNLQSSKALFQALGYPS